MTNKFQNDINDLVEEFNFKGEKRFKLIVLFGLLGDFDSFEYAINLQNFTKNHQDTNLDIFAIAIGTEKGKEKFPDARPRMISDNGPQFISKDFKEFIRLSGFTHVRTAFYYPQSNGKIERFHGTIKREEIRRQSYLSIEDARRHITSYIDHYNTERLHSAIKYLTPEDVLMERVDARLKERQQKLAAAKQRRIEAQAA